MYSRPQSFDGVPPLVSRRVLETLTYLARNHPYVANILLQFKLPAPLSLDSEKARRKAVMINEDDNVERPSQQLGSYAIALLLSLLNQPLYLGSIAHLEQLLNLLDVIIDNAHKKYSLSVESGVSASKQVPQILTSGADINTGAAALTSGSDIVPASSSKVDNSLKPSTSSIVESDTEKVLLNLPQAEL
ncbi:E3 ubiquitin-protein ligase UPL1-like [Impatiens glandulifera]|uniref:E3 ubiquitin-protein ligase UPL1-like n=1 Tax=Impatiens glandulifera TaxID=253017 RepID=UPI001FB065E0|nr:E3 ubiquitin-protein ligase UPL1-like [Impatiens glandulifera]